MKPLSIVGHPTVIGAALLGLFCAAAAHGAGEKPFDRSARPDLLTGEEKLWLEAHPVIRIASSQNYQPIESLNVATGRYDGVTAEYFSLIQSRLARQFEPVDLSAAQWEILDPVKRGADVITASAETPERLAYWTFTKPYLSLPTYLIARQTAKDGLTLKDLAGARVAMVKGWAIEEFVRANFPNVVIDPVPDVDTGLRKVAFGLVDAFASEMPVATEWTEKTGITNLKIAGEAGYTYRLSISVRKDWPELLGIFEKALATITPAERKTIYKRWLKIEPPAPSERLKRQALWGGAGLLAILSAVLAWNRMLSSRVHARTAQVRGELALRIEADEALRLSEEKFARAFRNSPDAIFMASLPPGKIIEVNESACRLTGLKREEFIGRTSVELKLWCSEAARAQYLATLQERGRVVEMEADFRMKDGQTRLGLISAEVLDLREGRHVLASVRHITDRKRAEIERDGLNAQLLESENEERRRIGRELHDTTAQHLAVIQMNLSRLREATPAGADATATLLAESHALAVQSVQEIRTLSYLLHPPLLDELGLAGALADYATGFGERSGIHVQVDTAGYSGRLPREHELALFRVAQESLTNMHRHSGSAGVLIRLERDAGEVRMEVQDSGRGLPPDATPGVGLRGMKERLVRIGGALSIESDEEGTTVLASVPVEKSGMK